MLHLALVLIVLASPKKLQLAVCEERTLDLNDVEEVTATSPHQLEVKWAPDAGVSMRALRDGRARLEVVGLKGARTEYTVQLGTSAAVDETNRVVMRLAEHRVLCVPGVQRLAVSDEIVELHPLAGGRLEAIAMKVGRQETLAYLTDGRRRVLAFEVRP